MERIYIVQGERGLFKAGRTKSIERRLKAMAALFKFRGDAVARQQFFDVIPNAQEAERLLLLRLLGAGYKRIPGNGRELFLDVDFEFAAAAAAECTRLGAPYVRLDTSSDAYIARKKAEIAEAIARGVDPNSMRIRTVRQALHNKLLAAHGRRSFEALVKALASDCATGVCHSNVDHHPV